MGISNRFFKWFALVAAIGFIVVGIQIVGYGRHVEPSAAELGKVIRLTVGDRIVVPGQPLGFHNNGNFVEVVPKIAQPVDLKVPFRLITHDRVVRRSLDAKVHADRTTPGLSASFDASLLRQFSCEEHSLLLVVAAEYLGDWENYEPKLTEAGAKLLAKAVKDNSPHLFGTFGTHVAASVRRGAWTRVVYKVQCSDERSYTAVAAALNVACSAGNFDGSVKSVVDKHDKNADISFQAEQKGMNIKGMTIAQLIAVAGPNAPLKPILAAIQAASLNVDTTTYPIVECESRPLMDYPTFADAHFLLGKTSHARIRLELEKLRTDAELWKTITVRIRKHVGNGHPRAAFLDDRVTASNEYLAAIDAQLKSDAPATANLPSIPAPGSKDLDGLLVLTHGWVRTNYGSKPSQNPNYLNTETAVAPVVEFLAPEFMLSVKFSGEYTDGPAAATAKANDDYDSLGGKAFRWTSPHGIKTVQIDEKELAAWANLYQALKSGDQSAAAIISHKSWASTRFAGGVARLPANHTMLIEHFETGQRNSRYWLTIRDIWGNDQRIDLGNGLTHPFQNN